jgi:hypothetical protein
MLVVEWIKRLLREVGVRESGGSEEWNKEDVWRVGDVGWRRAK